MEQYVGWAILLLVLMLGCTLCWVLLRTLPSRTSEQPAECEPTPQERLMQMQQTLETLRVRVAESPYCDDVEVLLQAEAQFALTESSIRREEFGALLARQRTS